jgi:hypothetical protein
MAMPAEVLSGPHQSPGHARYLIRKADGNVSLVPVTDIKQIIPRLDQMVGTLAVTMFGRAFVELPSYQQLKLRQAAHRALLVADSTKGQA